MTGAMIVEILIRVVPACRRDHPRAADIAIDQQGDARRIFPKCLEYVVGPCTHLVIIVGGYVRREQFRFPGLILGPLHGVCDQRNDLLHRAE